MTLNARFKLKCALQTPQTLYGLEVHMLWISELAMRDWTNIWALAVSDKDVTNEL